MVKTIDSREQLPIAVLHYLSTRDGRTHRVAKQRNVRPAQETPNHMLHIIVFSFPVPKTLKASISTGKERHLAPRSDAIFIAASKGHPNPDVGVNKV